MVQCYLTVNRVDLAETQLRTMQRADDDATITQLAASRFYLAQGGERIADALATLTDLADKYGATPALLSAQAVCAMRTGNWAEAERLLLQASERATAEPEVLVNLAVCALHTGKPREVVTRYITFVSSFFFKSHRPSPHFVLDSAGNCGQWSRTTRGWRRPPTLRSALTTLLQPLPSEVPLSSCRYFFRSASIPHFFSFILHPACAPRASWSCPPTAKKKTNTKAEQTGLQRPITV